eukprot:gene14007-16511_t
MSRKKIILIHVLCWSLLIAYFFLGEIIYGKRDHYFGYSMTVVQIVEFYVCYLWVYPRFLKKEKIPQLIGGLVVAMATFIFLRYFIEQMLFPKFLGIRNYPKATPLWYYIKDNLYFGTSYIMISAAVWGTERAFKTEKQAKQLKNEAIKAELSFLKSQINPHFLYNTLNYIYSLAIPVSDKMASAVLRLSDLMRYTLTESADGKVSLVREVEYMESYIELFRMRFDPNFFVEFTTAGISEQQRVSSLILIPFVENAFKHGLVNDAGFPVKIHLEVLNGRQLIFTVLNKISHHQKDRSSGIGLLNIYRRLDLIYPQKYELNIDNDGASYQSRLRIEL